MVKLSRVNSYFAHPESKLTFEANICFSVAFLLHRENVLDFDVWIFGGESAVILAVRHSDVLVQLVHAHRHHVVNDADCVIFSSLFCVPKHVIKKGFQAHNRNLH